MTLSKQEEGVELPRRLHSALSDRGHTNAEVKNMSPREMIREYAGWHLGDPSWGDDFYDLVCAAIARARGGSL